MKNVREKQKNHWNALSIRKLLLVLYFLKESLFPSACSVIFGTNCWSALLGNKLHNGNASWWVLCNIFSHLPVFFLSFCVVAILPSQFDGNAVTMLPFPGRNISVVFPFNDTTSAHFLSTVKIQCHVQSLFINRNEMLALGCSTSVLNGNGEIEASEIEKSART